MEDNTPKFTTPEMIERSHSIFTATDNVIRPMALGSRASIKTIATQVGTMLNFTPTQVFPYVNDFCHCTVLGYVSPGKFGGFIRSDTGRPLKTAKPTNTSAITTSSTNTDTNEGDMNNDSTTS